MGSLSRMTAGDEQTEAVSEPKRRLLAAVEDHLASEGATDVSLRGLAEGAGTSHRMLSYHFGSRDNLLIEVSKAVEARQREYFAEMLDDPDSPPVEIMKAMHARFTDPALRSQEVLFFELYVRALRDEADQSDFLPGAVEAWLPLLTELFRRFGLTQDEAEAEARLALAVSRGLLLDFLATGDRRAIDRAAEKYFERFES